MILNPGEKVHIIHRRHFEKEPHRHFVGVVDAYEGGIARMTGHVYTVDPAKFMFVRRPEMRTRVVSIVAGDLLLNIIPADVDVEKIVYKHEGKIVRVSDGANWHIDISETTWS